MQTVEPIYVPKSLQLSKADDVITVIIKTSKEMDYMLYFLIGISGFGFGLIGGLFGGFSNFLICMLVAGGLIFLLSRRKAPPMTLSSNGVGVGDRFYRMSDISGFRKGSDESVGNHLKAWVGFSNLGLKYGIYVMPLPYMLPLGETEHVVNFLSNLLQEMDIEIGAERDRKIQQSTKF